MIASPKKADPVINKVAGSGTVLTWTPKLVTPAVPFVPPASEKSPVSPSKLWGAANFRASDV